MLLALAAFLVTFTCPILYLRRFWSGSGLSAFTLLLTLALVFAALSWIYKSVKEIPSPPAAQQAGTADPSAFALRIAAFAACAAFLAVSLFVASDSLHVLALTKNRAEALRVLWVGSLAAIATAVVVMVGSYLAVFGDVTQAVITAMKQAGETVTTALGGAESASKDLLSHGRLLSRLMLATLSRQTFVAGEDDEHPVDGPYPLLGATNQFTAVLDAADAGLYFQVAPEEHRDKQKARLKTEEARLARHFTGGILQAYLDESAFDLSRRSIVTNSANYAAVTVGAARALEKSLWRKNRKEPARRRVLYLTNTVCHPCHLLNWPWSVESGKHPIRFSPDFILEYMTFMRYFAGCRDRYFHARLVSVLLRQKEDEVSSYDDCPMPPRSSKNHLHEDWAPDGFDTRAFDFVPFLAGVTENAPDLDMDFWYVDSPRRKFLAQRELLPPRPEAWAVQHRRLSKTYSPFGAARWNIGNSGQASRAPRAPAGPVVPQDGPSVGVPYAGIGLADQLRHFRALIPSLLPTWQRQSVITEQLETHLSALDKKVKGFDPTKAPTAVALGRAILELYEAIDKSKASFQPREEAELLAARRRLLVAANHALSAAAAACPPEGRPLLQWFAETFQSREEAGAFVDVGRMAEWAAAGTTIPGCGSPNGIEAIVDEGLQREFALVGVLAGPHHGDHPSSSDVAVALSNWVYGRSGARDDWKVEHGLFWIEATAEAPWRAAEISWKTSLEECLELRIGPREKVLIATYAKALHAATDAADSSAVLFSRQPQPPENGGGTPS